MIQRRQQRQQTLDRELPELAAQHLGNVRLKNTEQLGSRSAAASSFRLAALIADLESP